MKKLLTFIVTALILLFILPVANPVRAACSISNISVEISQSGSNIKVNNEDPAITGSIYVSASGSCSPSAGTQYFFRLRYYDDFVKDWRTQQSTQWQNSNNTDFGLNSGIRYYTVHAWIKNDNSTNADIESTRVSSSFYKMEKTSSVDSATLTATSAAPSWSLRMNYYPETSPSPPFPFYLLVGTDPAILTNRQRTTGEIPVNGIAKDADTTEKRVTWYASYRISTSTLLTPNTTYYWRIRGDHPQINDSYFAGGQFTTLPLSPTVTTLDITNLTPSSVTLNGQVNPNEVVTTAWFRYSTSHPGQCNDFFGTKVPITDGVDVGSGTSAVSFSQNISLPTQSTYYYCAIAQNSAGTSFGQIQSFRNSNRVFINSTQTKGGWIGGLGGADASCQQQANLAGLGGSWKAWLSDSQTSAASHLAHFDSPYTLVDGTTVIANNWADLTDGNLAQKINKNASGKLLDGFLTWTNTNPDGSINSTTDTCSNWTNTVGNSNLGHNGFTDGQWTKWGSGTCGNSAPLYCFEQSLTGSGKPDLSTSGLQLASGTLVAGSSVTFKANVKNSASAPVMDGFFNRFEINLNRSNFLNADVTLAPDTQVSPLSSGVALDANSIVTIESAAWSGIPGGTHIVKVCADPSNHIQESDENNNCTATIFTVSAAVCTGNISLTLDPSSTAGGGFVVPTASGLSNCSGKTINFKSETVNVGSCQSGSTGCSGQAFTAPGSIGKYIYSALIDKNGNGNTSDTGESTSATLIVSSALPPTTSISTCGADGLKILEGLVTSPPKQGQTVSQITTDPSTKCIIDPRAAFAPFKIPTFDDLKSLYYTQK